MIQPASHNTGAELDVMVCQRAVHARDPRFDGVFFVGITTTRIYCRPVCPARVTYADRRRFFKSAAAAEHAGYRPCLRCRPELAPGRALCDAVSRLAGVAANRITAGALNGRSVADLARDLCVSERHLRRALERELGVSPLELAQTHRLLLAKRLLTDTDLPITRVAFASGFQSLRRFNSTFHDQYRMSPGTLRKSRRANRSPDPDAGDDQIHLTLAYRPPLAWRELLACLRREAWAGVEVFREHTYGRTIEIDGQAGVLFVANARPVHAREAVVRVQLSSALLPVLMSLLARVRQLLDLDAQPHVVDTDLARGGLAQLVHERPGLRLPGALDGFEMALRVLLLDDGGTELGARLVREIGRPIDTGVPGLSFLTPKAAEVVQAGTKRLTRTGVSPACANLIVRLARAVLDRELLLEPGAPVEATCAALGSLGVPAQLVTRIAMRALHWPDAFPAAPELFERAARWRPWRAYAALHLELDGLSSGTCANSPPSAARPGPADLPSPRL